MCVPAPAMQSRIGPNPDARPFRHLSYELIRVEEVEQRISILRKTIPVIQSLLDFDGIVINRPGRAIERRKFLSDRVSDIFPQEIIDNDMPKWLSLIETAIKSSTFTFSFKGDSATTTCIGSHCRSL
jgi:hypothetical protein